MTQQPPQGEVDRVVGADRVLAVLVELARHPHGATLEDLAATLGSPKSTVHRALVSLRKSSLAQQTARGVYALGDEFIRLAFQNYESRPDTARLEPLLRELSSDYGETVHYAVLDGKDVVYRAKVDPPQGAVKLTSTIGGRNPAYRTAVGKVLLSHLLSTREQLDAWLGDDELPSKTEFTITDRAALLAELIATRERGYGIDDQENEIGINCVAVPVYALDPDRPVGAISVSALKFRHPIEELLETVPALVAKVQRVDN